MVFRSMILSFVLVAMSFGQALPDRDELTAKFLQPGHSHEAAKELVKHFQMGGLRTILRNINGLPVEERLQYGEMFKHLNLTRFRNDLNANVEEAKDDETKAMGLMLLATIGRMLDPGVFEPHIASETTDIRVRLAAASGIIKVQKPSNYDRFHEIAKEAIVDPTTGRNDLRYADITKANRSFYLYTKGALEKDKVSHGVIISAIEMAEADSVDMYEVLAGDRKFKKYIPHMIDRAIRVGGVQLLEAMEGQKSAKKYRDEIAKAKPAAAAVAKYRGKFLDKLPKDKNPIGHVLPVHGSGSGVEDYHAGYAVVKVSAEGDISIVESFQPFGGTNNLAEILKGKTFPAHLDWNPVESYAIIVAP